MNLQHAIELSSHQRQLRHVYRIRQVQRRIFAVAKVLPPKDGFRYNFKLVTLTYADGRPWNPKHISSTIRLFSDWYKSKTGVRPRYQWVMELQKNGKPHYHILIAVRIGLFIPYFDVPLYGARGAWWKHGTTNMVHDIKHGGAYMAKYVSKGSKASDYPRGSRIYGTFKDMLVSWALTWATAPRYVRLLTIPGEQLTKGAKSTCPAGYRFRVHPENQRIYTKPSPTDSTYRFTVIDRSGLYQSIGLTEQSGQYWMAADGFVDSRHGYALRLWEQFRLKGIFSFFLSWWPKLHRGRLGWPMWSVPSHVPVRQYAAQ